jgi:prepilin-type N-terminal cleavage/methylation domain-containing protein
LHDIAESDMLTIRLQQPIPVNEDRYFSGVSPEGVFSMVLKRRPSSPAGGFTLVELLVVITIIGILVGLTVPAASMVRERARKLQCANNLKNLGSACLQHEENYGYLPSGGWGWSWVGDPDRGTGMNQPGGWVYNVLPYIDQAALHDAGAGRDNDTKKKAMVQMVRTPLAALNCPSRRRSALCQASGNLISNNLGKVYNTPDNTVARTDYAANTGDKGTVEYWGGPDSEPKDRVTAPFHTSVYTDCTGIMFECSQVKSAQIKDGASNTLLLGEKYVAVDCYATGSLAADNENMYVGMDNDIGRSTCMAPQTDRFNVDTSQGFGSAHETSCNFVFCDGSIRPIAYTVDPTIFQCLGNRADGNPIDFSKIP